MNNQKKDVVYEITEEEWERIKTVLDSDEEPIKLPRGLTKEEMRQHMLSLVKPTYNPSPETLEEARQITEESIIDAERLRKVFFDE